MYKATVRPLPLSELSGGTRKVPMLDDAQGIPFLRIGKPESHAHANFLKHKAMRRQLRITAFQELWGERRYEAYGEDMWEAALEELADREGVNIPDVGDEGGAVQKGNSEFGPYEWAVRAFGVDYISAKLREEMVDMQARVTAMLDLQDEEQRLATLEKREKQERRRAAWEETVRLGKGQGPTIEHLRWRQSGNRKQEDARDRYRNYSKDDWTENVAKQRQYRGQKRTSTESKTSGAQF